MPVISGLVLAAGLSSRMGRPKQLLPLGETTVLGQVLGNASRSRLDEIVVVASVEVAEGSGLADHPGVRCVLNSHPELGQSESLKLGIASLSRRSRACVVLMSDQPLVSPQLIDRLIEEFETREPPAVVPVYDGVEGTPVLLARSLWAEIARLEGDVGARRILRDGSREVSKVEVSHLGSLLDIDTPEEYQAFLEERGNCPGTAPSAATS